ncbi:MAG: gt4D [Verrucomicrobiaceae bacterium]|nr:gt4D [Verrucomicrobiaceae bacterium]
MNILQLCDRTHDYVQGFDLTEEIARALAPPHHFIFGLLTGSPDSALQQRIGCEVMAFQLPKRKIKPINVLTVWRLVRFIRQRDIDLIIAHRFKPWLLLTVVSLFIPRVRCVGVFHAFKQFDRKRRRWWAKIFLTSRWQMIAVSDAVRDDLIAHGIPEQCTGVIRNAIDIAGVRAALLSREQARTQLRMPMTAIVIGTLGRTKRIKGHKYLIDAFARLAEKNPDLHLLIIGGGEGEDELRAQSERSGFAARITITGPLTNAARFLRAFDIFVFPSLNEGLGLAVLEAVAAHLPVIASAVGGIPEALGSDGIFVAPANAAQLGDAIERVLQWSSPERECYIELLERHLQGQFDIGQYHRRFRELAENPIFTR